MCVCFISVFHWCILAFLLRLSTQSNQEPKGNIYWLFERDTAKDERETKLVQQFLQFHIQAPVKITRVRELPPEKTFDIIICSKISSPSKISMLENSNLIKLAEVHGICIFVSKT